MAPHRPALLLHLAATGRRSILPDRPLAAWVRPPATNARAVGSAFCSYVSGVVIETAPRRANVASPANASDVQRALHAGWITPGQHVLDLGCGLGADLACLAEHGIHACGIDVTAASLVQSHPAAVLVLQADVLHLPFADETFDVLLDRGCLDYVPPAARAAYVGELERVLRPHGHLLLPDAARVSRAALSVLGIQALTNAASRATP